MVKRPVLTESFRDGIQGLHNFISTEIKVEYLNTLLKVGFDVIDFGSFVSPKAVPQMRDSGEVLKKLNFSGSKTEMMAIVGNLKGVEIASAYDELTWLAYPYSVSPTFLKLNVNADKAQSLEFIEQALNICVKKKKKLRVYLTMAFGNPYKDPYHYEMVFENVHEMIDLGVEHMTLSDITGESNPELIAGIYSGLAKHFPGRQFGFHLHTTPDTWFDKVDAAYQNGCLLFDAVINGMGGCPMTGYELLSNLNTANLLLYFDMQNVLTSINKCKFSEAVQRNIGLIEPYTSH